MIIKSLGNIRFPLTCRSPTFSPAATKRIRDGFYHKAAANTMQSAEISVLKFSSL